MIEGAKIRAAIEVLDDIATRKRPAGDALKDWGLAHRFAGSRDRAGIGTLVFDALRHRASAAYLMGEPSFAKLFGDETIAEMQALAARAPVDLRVNSLKGTREKALNALKHFHPEPTPFSHLGLRLPLLSDGRGPPIASETAYLKGLVEVQDEGSQIAVLLTCAKPGEQVLDLCAGAGGKSLGLASQMQNKGQVYASDSDSRRLAPIYARIERSTARNIQVRPPRGQKDQLADLVGRCDLVLVDAPCTGTGTWRRNPDAKWRMRPGALEERIKTQDRTLIEAARFVKPAGRIVYVTCSLLIEENEERIAAFLGSHPNFKSIPGEEMAEKAGLAALAGCASRFGNGLRLSPLKTQTDGFFIAALVNVAG
jgi:16S rRNA (cytosine967-C5)-methyltransferase